jgi:hypothetical protein
MRNWINLFETEHLDLDAILKQFNNDSDVEEATCGYCGTFALALYRFLTRHGVPARIIKCVTNEYDDGKIEWGHWVVEAQGSYWDVLGRAGSERPSFDEFFEVARYDQSSEAELVSEISHNPHLYSTALLARWTEMLEASIR